MKVRTPKTEKLLKSALISLGGIGFVLILKGAFPHISFDGLELAIVGAIGAWVTNTVRESLK